MAQEPQDRLKTRTREELLRSGAASRAIEHFNRIAGNRKEVAETPQKPTQRLVQHRPSCKKHRDHVLRKSSADREDSPAVSRVPVEEKKLPATSRRGSSRHRESQSAELPESSPAPKDVQLQRAPVGSESRVIAASKPSLTRSESHSDRSRPLKIPPEKISVPGKTDIERAGSTDKDQVGPMYKNPAGPTVEQLWPISWGAYSDNPDRDSLDGNLPSSSHGTNPPPPPPPILGTVATTAAFSKAPNSKKKHKKLLKGDDHKDEEEPDMSRSDPETGPVVWEKTEPCSQMWVVLSSMYGKLVVLLSIAFCLTEVMDTNILPFTFQGIFMMYLYVGSIIAILCIYITVVADNLPSVTSSKQNLTSAEPEIASLASFGTLKRAHISRSKTTRTSFYLRVGALLFGFGTLVYNGLEIAMHSTTDTACTGEMAFSHPILQSIFTFLQMHFLFVNSEVVVEKFGDVARFGLIHLVATNLSVWFRMVIWDSAHEWIHFVHLYANPNRPLQYGGTPSPQALQLQGFPGLKDLGYNGYVDLEQTTLPSTGGDLGLRDSGILFYGNPFSAYEGLSPPCLNGSVFPFTAHHARRVAKLYQCYNNNTLGQMWTKSMPYLFPFIVEYSLVAAAVTYIMWTSVGREKTKTTEVKKIATTGTLDIRRNKQWRTDCRAASKGLFMGLLCLVGGIVVLIIFFVMKDTDEFQEQMFWLSSGTQLVVLTLSVAMTMVGFYQIPKLSLQYRRQSLPLDSMLSSVTIFGVYMLGIFGVIVGGIEIQEPRHLVLFVLNVTLVVQVTLQGMLVAEASQRHCVSHQQQTIKPGRQVITFLLFSNVTLWMLDTLMSHHWLSHEMQFTYYGFLAWGVISRVGLPLMIFYRFHQAVILVGVWKNTYKTRAD